jgi:hypothetical protein
MSQSRVHRRACGRSEVALVERRKHRRTACDLRVRWQRVDTEHQPAGQRVATGPVGEASARDMSPGGLAFLADSAVEVGATLLLSLERSFGGPPLSALARVVRCAADGERWLVGVELTWIECTMPEQALGLTPENAWHLL